ncbi:hypothetical protein ACQ1ZH_15030, partial [Enterococcus faecalis]|uniref:hypothetical protein n=1 Tax=Enterococcus faecalis TaxID=1351 RepID=UPI003D6B2DBF
ELQRGNVAFDGESGVRIGLKYFEEELGSVKKFDPGIPLSLDNVVRLATAIGHCARYLTANV